MWRMSNRQLISGRTRGIATIWQAYARHRNPQARKPWQTSRTTYWFCVKRILPTIWVNLSVFLGIPRRGTVSVNSLIWTPKSVYDNLMKSGHVYYGYDIFHRKNSRRGPKILETPVALIHLPSGDQEMLHNCVADNVALAGLCSVVLKIASFLFFPIPDWEVLHPKTIGRRWGGVKWPPRSPDSMSHNVFSWDCARNVANS
jgi:hypothetical protein